MAAGLLYAAIIAMWVAYLVPKLRWRHDEADDLDAPERFSASMRVLPRRGRGRMAAPAEGESGGSAEGSGAAGAPERSRRLAAAVGARSAAARRRRVLGCLLAVTLLAVVLVPILGLPLWAGAAPVLLLIAYGAAICRQALRHGTPAVEAAGGRPRRPRAGEPSGARGPRRAAAGEGRTAARPVRVDLTESRVGEGGEAQPEVVDFTEPVLRRREDDSAAGPALPPGGMEPARHRAEVVARRAEVVARRAVQELTRSSAAPAGGGDWEPVPTTLPTYVTKPKAPGTHPSIDYMAPGTWAAARAGRQEQEAAEAHAPTGQPGQPDRPAAASRAVNE